MADNFTAISDPVTGLIKTQQDQYDTADDRLTDQIAELSNRIDFMQSTMFTKLQQADVLLASLEAQQSILTASLGSLDLLTFGKQESN